MGGVGSYWGQPGAHPGIRRRRSQGTSPGQSPMPGALRTCDHDGVMSPPLPEHTRRLRRSRRGRLAGGICRGLSLHLGANVWLLRLLFILFTWIGGLGVLTYAAFWIFVPLGDIPEEERSAPRPQVRLVLLALIALGIL